MAEHVFVTCPHCGHRNAYTLEELRRQSVLYRPEEARQGETFRVTCKKCGQPFVFPLTEANDAPR